MARIRRCRGCGFENRDVALYCNSCGIDLEGCENVDWPSQTPATHALQPEPPLYNDPLEAFLAPSPRPVRASLIFPWGEIEFCDRLHVGKDVNFSPIAQQLASFPTVSEVHAELWFDGPRLYLRNLSNTNPTYVNGIPYTSTRAEVIKDGDLVGFSNQLEARVRVRDWK